MGVSVQDYRCRIGLFNKSVPLSTCGVKVGNTSNELLLKILCATTLFCVLIVGGIELNPGPVHVCKFCGTKYSLSSHYFQHMEIHKNEKNFAVPCSQPSCKSVLTTFNSFSTHMQKFHPKPTPSPIQVQVLCPQEECKIVFNDFDSWKVHAINDHLKEEQTFTCIFTSCKTVIKNVGGFRTHLSRMHKDEKFEGISVPCLAAPSVTSGPSGASDMDESTEEDCVMEEDLYPHSAVRDHLAKFYLTLEATHLLPTSTVQVVAEEIAQLSRISHHQLRTALEKELSTVGVEKNQAKIIMENVFKADTTFNTHHRGFDEVQFRTDHLRCAFWKKKYKFVAPVPVDLGLSETGKKRVAHLIPVRETLQSLLEDDQLRSQIVESFKGRDPNPEVLVDFADGSRFQDHISCHHQGSAKCIQIMLFQDGFDPNAFSSGNYKPIGFYYTIGNLHPEVRFKLDLIQVALMVLEKDLKPTEEEELADKDRLKLALEPLIEELINLKKNGVLINGETVPVCLLFVIGDSLGQNYIANIVRNFSSSEFTCRFCPMSKTAFRRRPWEVQPFRTPQQYDLSVRLAKVMWRRKLTEALAAQSKRRQSAKKRAERVAARSRAPMTRISLASRITKTSFSKLTAISHQGVKYRPCPLNNHELNFHIVGSQPPCLSHDLHEGIFKAVVPRILKHFIEEKKWFDLKILNSRIVSFKCHGTDALDRPKALKSLKSLYGNAVENWNFVRLLPFIIGDLIQDKQNVYWQIYLQLKEISELVCAPQISKRQISVLRTLIGKYLTNIKQFQAKCLFPKHHYLCHYPDLICLYGPLIRLFTLRFESKHAYFKRVLRSCNNYINVTYTMTRKYMCKAALDRSSNLLPHYLQCGPTYHLDKTSLSKDVCALLPNHLEEMKKVVIHGTEYKAGLFLLLGWISGKVKVGKIMKVLWNPSTSEVLFLLEDNLAEKNCAGGYYEVRALLSHEVMHALSLPDYQPLSPYIFEGKHCLTLKHTAPFMLSPP